MHRLNNKWIVGIIVIILILVDVGCVAMVEGYKEFHIREFEDFFNTKTLEEKKEYIDSGKLDICNKEEILLIPFVKEVSETECAILLSPYSQNVNSKVILNEVSLTTAEGEVISFTKDFGEIEVLSQWKESMTIVNVFNKSDSWFYNGNNLKLIINMTIQKEDDIVETEVTYDITIEGYRGTSIQV